MPYEWHFTTETAPEKSGAFSFAAGEAPFARLNLWPHRSLPRTGFVWFVGITSALFGLPLIGVIGTPALWGLLPYMLIVVAAIWWALKRSYRDGRLAEELSLWRDRVHLLRRPPGGEPLQWTADPYWVRVNLRETGGPVDNYLTLKGGGREVEIGAFLSPDERLALRGELLDALKRVR